MESRKKHEAKEYSPRKMMIRATKIEYESYGQRVLLVLKHNERRISSPSQ
jgi:hypothetical protein